MSRGQLPRTVWNYPRMKIRGKRRRMEATYTQAFYLAYRNRGCSHALALAMALAMARNLAESFARWHIPDYPLNPDAWRPVSQERNLPERLR